MRRKSLVGPLLLIAIGVWFLISALRPDLPLLDIAARYWPFLLIGWGALRAAEIVTWTVRGRGLPYAGVSGGEWTLVVFICLIGSALSMANRYRPWANFGLIGANRVEIFGRTYDYPVPESKVEAGKAARILVENLRGSARITGADVHEVTVNGRKTVRSLQEREADNANRQSPVEVTTQGDQVIVRTNQDRITGDERVSTEIEITVPRAMSVEVRSRSGEVEIADISGAVDVSSDRADSVHVQNIGGNVHLNLARSDMVRAATVKGNVSIDGGRGRDVELDTISGEVTINGTYSGDFQLRNLAKLLRIQMPNTELRVEGVPGQIHMDLGQISGVNLVGPVHLSSSRARDVELEQFTQALDLRLDRGDISLRPMQAPLAKIDARTGNGQVDVTLPGDGRFALKAVTGRGEISNEFGPLLKVVSEGSDEDSERKGGSITGGTGQGPAIVVQTDRGSITVRKDTGAPLAAQNETPARERPREHQGPQRLEIEKQ